MALIRIENASVDFMLASRARTSFKDTLRAMAIGGFLRRAHGQLGVSALSNINLEIKDGDRVGILGANGDMGNTEKMPDVLSIGELSLDGRVRPVRGALSIALCAKENGIKNILIPEENAPEAAVVKEVNVFPIRDLREAAGVCQDLLKGQPPQTKPLKLDISLLTHAESDFHIDFNEVRGQKSAKRALEVASAGGHNILLIGPPGSGKTMLAKRLPTILPPLEFDESLEITKIHSVAGLTGKAGLVTRRPFKSTHHTVSQAGLIGGGSIPKPGEVSLAHHGVLFLDELPEFDRSALEVLRQPLEDKEVTISRAALSLTFPANFTLVASMNPCPCGFYGTEHGRCVCSAHDIARYKKKVSGPIIDRIDIWLPVEHIEYEQLTRTNDQSAESSEDIRARVRMAREKQYQRQGKNTLNNTLSSRDIQGINLSDSVVRLLQQSAKRMQLSPRAYHRVIKLARTIADLEQSDDIQEEHVLEALQYRPQIQ